MMTNNNLKILIMYLFLITSVILFSTSILAYKSSEDNPVHQYIVNESQFVWNQIPLEIKDHLKRPLDYPLDKNGYSQGEDIITGSGEEDKPIWEAFEHFWDPDNPNYPQTGDYNDGLDVSLLNQRSSYIKSLDYWENKVIPLYTGKKDGSLYDIQQDEAYYWLGRVVHPLEDAAVPEHMHNDCHLAYWYVLNYLTFPIPTCENSHSESLLPYDDSSLEEYTGEQSVYSDYEGSDHSGAQYNYEDLPNFNSWSGVQPSGLEYPYLFRLFWYTSQKTQYYASDDVDGNAQYNTLNDLIVPFSTSLWQGDGVTIVSSSAALADDDIKVEL